MLLSLALLVCWSIATTAAADNLWVVIVTTSRYWFNYRHTANGVLVYQIVRSLGVPDSRIIFMNSLDVSGDARNPNPGYVSVSNGLEGGEWSFEDVEVDYAMEEVTAQSFLRFLSGRPLSSEFGDRLGSDANSSVLLYLSGHGGDEFFKFHDNEELSAQDLAYALQEMHVKGMYKQLLLVLDTCQASTMATYITAPHVTTLASSARGENSYAYPTSGALGVATVDRFTYSLYCFFRDRLISPSTGTSASSPSTGTSASNARSAKRGTASSSLSLHDLHLSFSRQLLHSTPTVVSSPGARDPRQLRLTDFFGGHVEGVPGEYGDSGGSSPHADYLLFPPSPLYDSSIDEAVADWFQ